MRRRWLVWAAVFTLVFLLLALVRAPARLVAWVLPPSQAVGIGYGGTLWDGRVADLVIATPAGPLQLGAVRWTLSPGSLVTGAPRLRWESQWGTQRLKGEARRRSDHAISLSDVEFAADAAALQRLLPLALAGRFSGLLAQVEIQHNRLVGLSGQVSWRDATWRDGDSRFSLGSYAVEFRPGAEGATLGEVITLGGALEAAGRVSLARDGVFSLALNLRSDEPLAPALQRALSLVAVPRDQGFHIQLDGTLYPQAP